MSESYTLTALPVNPLHLTPALKSTYDLVCALARRTGYCYARASWLAQRLGVSESQLSRRLKQLRDFGLLSIEQIPGLKRLLRPIGKINADSLPSIDSINGDTQQNLTHPLKNTQKNQVAPVVASLCKQGIAYATARNLAQTAFEECQRQLARFDPSGKRNPAGWLRKAIENGWSVGKSEGDLACQGQHARSLRIAPSGLGEASGVKPPMELLRQRLKEGMRQCSNPTI